VRIAHNVRLSSVAVRMSRIWLWWQPAHSVPVAGLAHRQPGIERVFDFLGAPMKGDRIEIVVDDGGGNRTYEVAATRAGRRVEVLNRRGFVEVSEVTRNGTPVRTARFMATRIIALVEYPANDQSGAADRHLGSQSP
jgi:hypothetical protein